MNEATSTAVQAATTKILNELTKYCPTTNILTPENYPLYGTCDDFLGLLLSLHSHGVNLVKEDDCRGSCSCPTEQLSHCPLRVSHILTEQLRTLHT